MNTETNRHIEFLLLVSVILLLCVVTMFLTGCAGPQGDQGIQGLRGLPGPSTPVMTQPAASNECPNGGVDVTVGLTTTSICNGQDGSNGQQGNPGQNGTIVTTVQFCPGAPSYPNVFPESGLVINGVVFGVYSANGGFLAELPAGLYASNAVGSSCTFTINPDGTIAN